MSLSAENGSIPATMLVGPTGVGGGAPYPVYMNGNGGGSSNGGFGDGNGWWIILLFILIAAMGGNWGGNNNGGNGGGGFFGGGQPIIVNDGGNGGSVQRGFDQAAIMAGIGDINSGIYGIQNSLCNGFAGVNQTVSNGFAQAEIAENARQMANMQQMFNLSTQFANCCCENRLGIANLGADIARENCADRAAIADGIRDILVNNTANTQRILDQMCNDKIDAKNEKIADLERQLTMANLNASQIAQTAQIQRGQVAEVDALYQRLRDCPVPTMPVYGSQPIFTCPNNNGCGCGCGNNF